MPARPVRWRRGNHMFLTEIKQDYDLTAAYPHTPEDVNQSIADYLSDKFDNNWTFVAVNDARRYFFMKK